MANRDEMLSKAVRFDIGRLDGVGVFVEARGSSGGTMQWVVRHMNYVLNTDGEWEYEPMPSNRGDDFIAGTRFELDDAWARAEAVVGT